MDDKKECKNAMKNIYNCHIHVHDQEEFFRCSLKDLEKYVVYCKKIYEKKDDIKNK